MLALIQLVSHAEINIDNRQVATIQRGILGLIGLEKTDTEKEAEKIFNRISHYRIFPDDNGKMNRSLLDIQGGLLLVPQFTLVADTNQGTRPGFSRGMAPDAGEKLFTKLVTLAKANYHHVSAGVFGANMQINLCNDGPVTFMLQV